jgi:rod shape-determining protein MreC
VLVTLTVIILIIADLRFNRLETTRALLDAAATPIYWLADVPTRIGDWSDANIRSRAELLEENERLRRENLVLQGRSHQMASLQAENVRLRSLLNSSALLRDDVLVAELIGVSPDPVRHQVVINKGEGDGVFLWGRSSRSAPPMPGRC